MDEHQEEIKSPEVMPEQTADVPVEPVVEVPKPLWITLESGGHNLVERIIETEAQGYSIFNILPANRGEFLIIGKLI